jgi:hypothetical protein
MRAERLCAHAEATWQQQMAAGVTDYGWEIKEIVSLRDLPSA